MPVKVAFIGAGSVGFTRRLTQDILAVPELRDTVFSFTDINRRNLDMVTRLCRKDIESNRLPAQVIATTDRRRALECADYIFNTTRIGGLEAFRLDIEIPLKYGVDQCVGDTLAPGGIFYGQRNAPALLEFCKDIREVAKPGALLMNYANPMAINTWVCLDYGGVSTVGLCHGVEGGWHQIAMALGADPQRWREEVEIVCAGINHQTWYIRVLFRGRLVSGEELLEAFERHPVYRKTEKVRIDVLRRFGYYSTESNGHLSEYVPWYRKRPREIRRWIDLSSWINGETGGYLRVCMEGRNWFETDFPRWMADESPKLTPETRGHEHGSYIIEAIETGRIYRGHFNVRNHGCIPNLPPDGIVEVPGYVDRHGIHIPRVGELPHACAATCAVSVHVQRMAKEAGVRGDVTLLKQALLHDPLTAAVCDPDEIWRMADEMLVAEARWLPQYAHEIAAARRRMKKAPPPPFPHFRGAARRKVRTVKELRAAGDAAKNETLAADKAAAQRMREAERSLK